MAIAVPVHVQGEICALGVAGPIHRIEEKLDRHLKALRALLAALEKPTKGVKP